MRECLPYVRIEVLFTEVRVSVSEACRSVPEGGMTLTSEPVLTKNRVCVVRSFTKKRRLDEGPGELVATSVRPGSFPKSKGLGSSWPCPRTCDGSSKGSLEQGRRKSGQDSENDGV